MNRDCIDSCPDDCEETTYKFVPSYTSLVSKNSISGLHRELEYVPRVYTNEDMDENGEVPPNDAFNLTKEFFQDSIVGLEIGYSHFNVEITKSSPDQTLSSFISNIGGLLGLVAGISFMTIYEFLEYPFLKLLYHIRKQKTVAKTQPVPSRQFQVPPHFHHQNLPVMNYYPPVNHGPNFIH